MSQLYVADRPAAIPVTELEQRRKKKDMQEIIEVHEPCIWHAAC